MSSIRSVTYLSGRTALEDPPLVARNRILLNIDIKLGENALPGIAAVARALGMQDQIMIRWNVWNADPGR